MDLTCTGTTKLSLEANYIQYLKFKKEHSFNNVSQTHLRSISASSKFEIIWNLSNLLPCLYN